MNLASAKMLSSSSEVRHQLIRFAAVGTFNTSVSYGLYAAFLWLGLPFWAAALFATCLGVLLSFATLGKIVFRSRLEGRFGRFVLLWVGLYLLNIAAIAQFMAFGLDAYSAGLLALVPITGLSFVLQRTLIFTPRQSVLIAAPRVAQRPMLAVLCFMLAACLAMRVHMIFNFEINWDEFLNLSMVHDWRRGELHELLQTAFVHLFGWVPAISGNEVDQIVAARALMLGAALLTSFCIFGIARRFVSIEAALFAVLAYNAFSFVFRHGISLRTDPLATASMMAALWLSFAPRLTRQHAILLGIAVAAAGAMTIKSVFFLPLLGSVFLIRFLYDRDDRRCLVEGVVLAAAAGAVTFIGILSAHGASLVEPRSPLAFLERTSSATLARQDVSTFTEYLMRAFMENWPFWILLALGTALAARQLRNIETRRDALLLLSLGLLLLTPIAYSEIYPYFYPLALAPVAVIVGFGFERLRQNGAPHAIAALVLIFIMLSACWLRSAQQSLAPQRQVLATVHDLFPSPVPYIDSVSMVSSYPKKGLFMSRWGMREYRAAGMPVMESVIQIEQPQFLLDGRGSLNLERLDPENSHQHPFGLLRDDVIILKSAFLRYWGPLYVPGLRLAEGRGTHRVWISGNYRLESERPVTVDGRELHPGRQVYLAVGNHHFAASAPFALIKALPRPPDAPAPAPLFHDF